MDHSVLSMWAYVAIIRGAIKEFVPQEVVNYLRNLITRREFHFVVERKHQALTNEIFESAMVYLGDEAKCTTSNSTHFVNVGKNENMKNFSYRLPTNTDIVDVFEGVPMKWRYICEKNDQGWAITERFVLSFHKEHIEMVKNQYLSHIISTAKVLRDQNRVINVHTVFREDWDSGLVTFKHPMTFETLAMDGDLKKKLIDDIDSFINGKDYYKKIGKVWKRGYLLYGPPGTGKSSLIAAMANYLNFDIYNLNLSAVDSDFKLQNLFLQMANPSILVIEDIDCLIKLQNRQLGEKPDDTPCRQVTLSGLLNAIDGLLSCCGDERIVVFTTNHKDHVDPALLRAGRMDMHICLSYCTYSIFKQLAATYLEISDHALFSCVEMLLQDVKVSPAEVAGEIMKSTEPKSSLEGLIMLLENKTQIHSERNKSSLKEEHQGCPPRSNFLRPLRRLRGS